MHKQLAKLMKMEERGYFQLPLSRAALRVFILLQKYTYPALIIKPGSYKPERNPKFHNRWPSLIRHVMLSCLGFHLIFALHRILFVFSSSDSSSFTGTQQMICNFYFLCVSFLPISFFFFMTLHCDEIILLISSCCEICLPNHILDDERKIAAGDVIVYGFSASMTTYWLLGGSLPFMVDYDHIHVLCEYLSIELKGMFVRYTVKVLISIYYTVLSMFGSTIMLLSLLILVVVIEGVIRLTRRLCPKLIHRKSILEIVKLSSHFSLYFHRFRISQLLTKLSCLISAWYMQNLLYVGIVVASCSSYVLLKMWSLLPLPFIGLFVAIATSVFAIIFIFIKLASLPNVKGKKFKQFWSFVLTKKFDRRRLASCPEIGFAFGTFRYIQNYYAMDTANTILDVICNMVLVD